MTTTHTVLPDLREFTGSETWYRHGLNRNVLFTDGAKYVADHAGAYWLLDEIALSQLGEKTVTKERFQVWKLAVEPTGKAMLSCENGNTKTVFTKEIPWTDFPQPGITLWFTDNTIFLPSEY